MEKYYSMVRVDKMKRGSVWARGRHVARGFDKENPPPEHIDSSLSAQNVYIGPKGEIVDREHVRTYTERINAAIQEHKQITGRSIRKDAIPAYELVLARSDLGEKEGKFDNHAWMADSVEWVENRFGAENIVGGSMHMDEPDKAGKIHPHIHIVMTPGVQATRGTKLSFKATSPGPGASDTFRTLQTSYGAAMKPFGLERGEIKEKAIQHIEPKDFREGVRRREKSMLDKYKDLPRRERKEVRKSLGIIAEKNQRQDIDHERKIAEKIEKLGDEKVKIENENVQLLAEIEENERRLEYVASLVGKILEAHDRDDEEAMEKHLAPVREILHPGQNREEELERENDEDKWGIRR